MWSPEAGHSVAARSPRAPRLVGPAVLAAALGTWVLGTFGTARGGLDFSGTIYAGLAVPMAVLLASAVAGWQGIRRGLGVWRGLLAPELLALCGAVAWMGLGMLVLGRPSASTAFVMGASVVLPLAVLSAGGRSGGGEHMTRWLAHFLVIGGLLAVTTGLWSLVVGPIRLGPFLIEYNPLFFRVNAWFNSSTMLGLFLAHGIFACFYLGRRRAARGRRAWGWWSVAAALALGIGLSGGRTGAVVAVATLGATLVLRIPLRLGPVLRSVVAAVAVVGLVAAVVVAFGDEIYLVRRFTDREALVLGDRDQFAADAWRELRTRGLETALFGVGTNGVVETLRWPVGAHSGVVRIALEHGLPTLALLVSAVLLAAGRLAAGLRDAAQGAEREFLLRVLIGFGLAELTVIQLLGVDMFHVLFCVTLGVAAALSTQRRVA